MKKRKGHGVLSNIVFYLGVWRRRFPLGIFLIIIFVPIRLIAIYSQIKIPQLIVRGLEQGLLAELIIKQVLWALIIMTLLKLLGNVLEIQLKARGSRPFMWLYSEPIHAKLFRMNYQQLISPEVQKQMAKIQNIVFRGSDGGPIHYFGFKLGELLIAFTGILIFSPKIVLIDPLLLLVIVLSAAINLVYGVYSGRYSAQNMRDRSEAEQRETYLSQTLEKRDQAKDIRFYSLRLPLLRLFERYHQAHRDYLKRESRVLFGAGALTSFSLFFRDIVAYAYLIIRLRSGLITISDFVFLVALIMQFSRWTDAIVSGINELIIFSANIDQLRWFIDLEDWGEKRGELAASVVSEAPSIEFKNLSFAYPGSQHKIFADFNLRIEPGERIALVGINGAGKTTLMQLLLGLLQPSSGQILIDGIDSQEFDLAEYYSLFSPVFQDVNIFPQTLAANIAGARTWDPERMAIAIEDSGIQDFVQDLPEGIMTKLVRESSDQAIDLSGGMNQRLYLARALYKDGKINILDEPTAALDPIAESRIYEEYNQMSQDKTSIFISHRLASTRFCSRILYLDQGRVLEEGDHNQLIAKGGKYAEMYEAQSKHYQEEVGQSES